MTSLADWFLSELRALMPDEAIFDGLRSGETFDGRSVPDSVAQYVSVYCPSPSHEMVTLQPSKDRADVTVTVHSFGTSRREVEWRQSKVKTLKNRVPVVDGYEFNLIEHPISRDGQPDASVPDRLQLYAVDQFRVVGFEK